MRQGLALALMLQAAVAAGCARPLLSPEEERTPFDRYDGIRNQYAAVQVENEYRRLQPNMTARLAPKIE
ncbi:MAG: hypothetical protein KIT68_06730 [Phycisphaeraceae bacterium]|nr:hypothetical protein [Phycisphaeraceae bacterium]